MGTQAAFNFGNLLLLYFTQTTPLLSYESEKEEKASQEMYKCVSTF